MSERKNEHLPVHSHQHSMECSTNQPDPAIFSETQSLVFPEYISSERIQRALTLWVEEIVAWAKDHAYLVGHIKLFVDGQENLWLSSTGRTLNIKHSPGWKEWFADRATLCVTVIVFGMSKEVLGELAKTKLQTCLNCIIGKDGADGREYERTRNLGNSTT